MQKEGKQTFKKRAAQNKLIQQLEEDAEKTIVEDLFKKYHR